jgi:hypothetical protein
MSRSISSLVRSFRVASVVVGIALAFPSCALALDVIDVTLIPETPDANQDVTIRLSSYTTDLDSSRIIWVIDGNIADEGIGMKSITTRTKDYGVTVNVEANIVTPKGERLVKHISLGPRSIDLLWEAQTYTPPFYKGKARPSPLSKVKVAAIPRFNTASDDPKHYVYTWSIRKGTKVGSGLGKNSALIESPRENQTLDIRVDIETITRDVRGTQSASIKSERPIIRFYERSPLLGLRIENALGDAAPPIQRIGGDSVMIQAIPYFFSRENVLAPETLRIRWLVDDQPADPDIFPLRITLPGISGSRFVSLDIRNNANVFQSAFARSRVNTITK